MKIRILSTSLLMCCLLLFTSVSTADDLSDTVITSKVKAKIAMDQSIPFADIHVATKDDVVSVVGIVKSNTQAAAIVQMIEATDGVKDVNALHLKVKGSKQPLTDTFITAKVKGLFIRENVFGTANQQAKLPSNISVETNNDVVYLTGTADNQQQVAHATELAKTIDGVKRVESRIKVQS